jgi:hypothetical protein
MKNEPNKYFNVAIENLEQDVAKSKVSSEL